MKKVGVIVYELVGVELNLCVLMVNKGVVFCKENNIDFLLVVGGGSVIDCMKVIVVGVKYDGDVWDIVMKKY